jgi:hypothetical protein
MTDRRLATTVDSGGNDAGRVALLVHRAMLLVTEVLVRAGLSRVHVQEALAPAVRARLAGVAGADCTASQI